MEAKKDVLIIEAESGDSSTEESESPRSVVVQMKKNVERMRSQVLRIIEEESHLEEDFFVGDYENKNHVVCGDFDERRRRRRRRPVNLVLVSRPILPRLPLSGKSNVKRPFTEATEIHQDYGREISEKDYIQPSIEGELQYLA